MRSLCILLLAACTAARADGLGIGAPASADLVRAWNIDIAPDGRGLPPGSGSVARGAQLFAERCAACHGPSGEGKPEDRLTGGQGTLTSGTPVKTVGSFWPYATTLFDYVRRAMPFNAPQSLGDEEVYALIAYLLYLNGVVGADAVMDAHSLPTTQMPNRGGFVGDPRPDTY